MESRNCPAEAQARLQEALAAARAAECGPEVIQFLSLLLEGSIQDAATQARSIPRWEAPTRAAIPLAIAFSSYSLPAFRVVLEDDAMEAWHSERLIERIILEACRCRASSLPDLLDWYSKEDTFTYQERTGYSGGRFLLDLIMYPKLPADRPPQSVIDACRATIDMALPVLILRNPQLVFSKVAQNLYAVKFGEEHLRALLPRCQTETLPWTPEKHATAPASTRASIVTALALARRERVTAEAPAGAVADATPAARENYLPRLPRELLFLAFEHAGIPVVRENQIEVRTPPQAKHTA